MTHEERVFEMMKAIAPTIVNDGLSVMERIINAGSNPSDCTIGGMTILEAQAQSAMEWAEAFVKEFEKLN